MNSQEYFLKKSHSCMIKNNFSHNNSFKNIPSYTWDFFQTQYSIHHHSFKHYFNAVGKFVHLHMHETSSCGQILSNIPDCKETYFVKMIWFNWFLCILENVFVFFQQHIHFLIAEYFVLQWKQTIKEWPLNSCSTQWWPHR